jgi:Zn-finger nucleic acid-binding protein
VREGVEIDFCPSCRSIWLDRGELEKLVNRLGTWFPDNAGYERHWAGDIDRLGPSTRLDEPFELR